MKRFFFIAVLAFATVVRALAQDTEATAEKHWTFKGLAGVNFSQSTFTNWAAGGQNTLAWLGTFNYAANYAKDNFKWDNSLNTAIGYSFYDFNKKPIKTDDKLDFTSLAGLKATETLNYSLEFAFRSQFTKGYDYKVDSTHYTSRWIAPAYITLGLGMEYVPNTHISLNFAPVTGRITIVNDTVLATSGAYGVNLLDTHDQTLHTPDGKVRFEFGARFSAKFNYTVFKNVDWESKIDLFSNYLNHPERVDVNWQNLLVLKVNSWLNCNFNTHLIYDYDVKFPELDAAGSPILDPVTGETLMTKGSKVQFKEVFSVGIMVNL